MARLSNDDLVRHWFRATAELHRRGVKLWHAGDYAELLVATAIAGTRAKSDVQRGYDLIGPDGRRWQVKAMVVNRPGNTRTSVGWLRPDNFDVLAAPHLDCVHAHERNLRFGRGNSMAV